MRAVDRRGVEIDPGDAEVGEARQLAGVADAVVVEVLPDLQTGEGTVAGVDQPVAIAVEGGERRQPAGMAAAGEIGREDLGAVVDGAGAVDVERQDAVLARGPGDLVGDAVAVDVEGDAVGEAGEREARRAEVEDDGVGDGEIREVRSP